MRCHKCRLLRRKIRDRKWSSRRSGKMERSCCLTSRGRRSSVATNRTQEEFLSRWQQPSVFSCASYSSSVLSPVCCRHSRSFSRNSERPRTFFRTFPAQFEDCGDLFRALKLPCFCDNLRAVVRNSWIARCFPFPFLVLLLARLMSCARPLCSFQIAVNWDPLFPYGFQTIWVTTVFAELVVSK